MDEFKAAESAQQADTTPSAEDDSSQIVEFYKGRCVLVTGASGFLGKLIIEKLLRSCTQIKKIFVLVRPKKNIAAAERVEQMLDTPLFSKLKSECAAGKTSQSFSELANKLVVLEGNLEKPHLDLNEGLLNQLAQEVSVVIHSAAIVSFVGKLRLSTDTNLVGTRNLLQLAATLPKLCAFVHVSTCYSNCGRKVIDEHLYPVKIDPEHLIKIAETLEDEPLEVVRNKLIGEHPNNYTLTKQLAEYLCGQFVIGPHQLPVLICRPSIIVSTLEEPMEGYLDNYKAANGLYAGCSRGFLRYVEGRPNTLVDLVPADIVSNCVISLAWFADLYHRARQRIESKLVEPNADFNLRSISSGAADQKMMKFYQERKSVTVAACAQVGLEEKFSQVPVVNISSGSERPMRMQQMLDLVAKHSIEYPSTELFRKPGCTVIESTRVYAILQFLEHTLVGKFMDCFCQPPEPETVTGSGAKRYVTWSRHMIRYDTLTHVLAFFSSNSFQFESTHRKKLINYFMNNSDRKHFNCDFRRIDFELYVRDMVLGIRRYLTGESDDTLPEARRKYRQTLWRLTLVRLFFLALISCFAYTLFS